MFFSLLFDTVVGDCFCDDVKDDSVLLILIANNILIIFKYACCNLAGASCSELIIYFNRSKHVCESLVNM